MVGHAGLLRAVATLLLRLLRVSGGDGVLGVVGVEATVVVLLLLVEMKSGVRGAGLGGWEGGRGDLLLLP